jgi:hypothetical protein
MRMKLRDRQQTSERQTAIGDSFSTLGSDVLALKLLASIGVHRRFRFF